MASSLILYGFTYKYNSIKDKKYYNYVLALLLILALILKSIDGRLEREQEKIKGGE